MPRTALARCVLLATLTGLAACDVFFYEPGGQQMSDLVPPEGRLALDFGGADTLEAWGQVDVRYAADLRPQDFVRATLTVAGQQLESRVAGASFPLDTRRLADGFHTVTLHVYTRTRSGSLADRLGAELFAFEAARVLYVENGPLRAPANVRVEAAGGRPRVSWLFDRAAGFSHFTLTRYDTRLNHAGVLVEEAALTRTFADPERRAWVDSSEVIGPGRYEVRAHTQRGPSQGSNVRLSATAPLVAPESTPEGLWVRWRQAPFAESFGRYVLERDPHTAPVSVVRTSRADTAVLLTDLSFGRRARLRVRLETPSGTSWTSDEVVVQHEGTVLPVVDPRYALGFFWGRGRTSGALERFDPATGALVAHTLPPHADFAFSRSGRAPVLLVHDAQRMRYLLDPFTLAVVLPDLHLTFPAFGAPTTFRVADARYVFVGSRADGGRIHRFDVQEGREAGTLALEHPPVSLDVTPGGRYALSLTHTAFYVHDFDSPGAGAGRPDRTGQYPVQACPASSTPQTTGGVLDEARAVFFCDDVVEVREMPTLAPVATYRLGVPAQGATPTHAYGYSAETERFVVLAFATGLRTEVSLPRDAAPYALAGPYVVDADGTYALLSSLR